METFQTLPHRLLNVIVSKRPSQTLTLSDCTAVGLGQRCRIMMTVLLRLGRIVPVPDAAGASVSADEKVYKVVAAAP